MKNAKWLDSIFPVSTLKYVIFFFLSTFACFGCNDITKKQQLRIDFSSDSSTIFISGMNDRSLAYLRNNLQTDPNYKDIVSVVQIPADEETNGREIPINGVLRMKGDSMQFTPENEFVKGKQYLIETMVGANFGSASDLVASTVGDHVKAQQKILKR